MPDAENDSDEEEISVLTKTPASVTKGKMPTTGIKKRSKMIPAPIDSLTDFNVSEYLQNLPCELTVGQAAHLLSKYCSGMQKAMRRLREKETKEKEANFVGSDDEVTTAA